MGFDGISWDFGCFQEQNEGFHQRSVSLNSNTWDIINKMEIVSEICEDTTTLLQFMVITSIGRWGNQPTDVMFPFTFFWEQEGGFHQVTFGY